VGAKGQFRSLAEPWADTATSTGWLMIAVLGGLADVERDLIRTRTAEGRSRAKAPGQHMGRPPSLTQQQKEAPRRRAEGENAQGTGEELQRRQIDDFKARGVSRTPPTLRSLAACIGVPPSKARERG
jgi:DNA invertase Pin-like site-specific DNA recombinase